MSDKAIEMICGTVGGLAVLIAFCVITLAAVRDTK